MPLSHEDLVKHLNEFLLKEQVSTNATILEQHSQDESYHTHKLPEVVLFPYSTKDVSNILKFANDHLISVAPFGLGTSLEGHIIPYEQELSIDFSYMNKVLDISVNDFLVTVQPGVTRSTLNKALKKHGLFFPVDPGADATLGGMVATNASGTTSVKYGVMRDQVRDLEVVLADGRIIHTGNRAAKSSSGYNLNGLFTGSEGTLGAFTELTLKVHGIPEHIVAGRATFATIKDAIEAVVSILQAGIPIARVELVDEDSIKQVNSHSKQDFPVKPTLFLEFHGNEAGLNADVDFMKLIVEDHQCESIEFEKDNKKRNMLWEARHNLAYAYTHGHPGKKMMVTDVVVPISKLAEAVIFARSELDKTFIDGGILGHVGDGNFHVLLMFDPNNEAEVKSAHAFNEKLVMYAINNGGTCTGEHGVGIGKQKYQRIEHGEAYDVMLSIKQVLDPNNILNADKKITLNERRLDS